MTNSLTLTSRAGAKASNLALALACLPPARREAALVFYDFCRTVDDLADDPGLSIEKRRLALEEWKDALCRDHSKLPPPLARIISEYSLETYLLEEIVLGMEMDLDAVPFPTFKDLQGYCWRVACAVGLVSLKIFGAHHPNSRLYAESLGYALQMTNILRDVAEDARRGRVYLPDEDLTRFGVTRASLLAGRPDGDFTGLMRFEADRAHQYFAETHSYRTDADRDALVAAEMMRETYQTLLGRMETGGFDVFTTRYRLAKWEKLLILTRTRIRHSARRVTGRG